MSINYDPDKTPDVPPETFELASELGMHVVNVICNERDAKVGDHSGVSFAAMVPFLPRAGDQLQLDDNRMCTVIRSYFKVIHIENHIALSATVSAVLNEE